MFVFKNFVLCIIVHVGLFYFLIYQDLCIWFRCLYFSFLNILFVESLASLEMYNCPSILQDGYVPLTECRKQNDANKFSNYLHVSGGCLTFFMVISFHSVGLEFRIISSH